MLVCTRYLQNLQVESKIKTQAKINNFVFFKKEERFQTTHADIQNQLKEQKKLDNELTLDLLVFQKPASLLPFNIGILYSGHSTCELAADKS